MGEYRHGAHTTLTEPQLIGPGETWTATVEGLPLADLTLRTT